MGLGGGGGAVGGGVAQMWALTGGLDGRGGGRV
jgi:hypothetical protein